MPRYILTVKVPSGTFIAHIMAGSIGEANTTMREMLWDLVKHAASMQENARLFEDRRKAGRISRADGSGTNGVS